ERQRCARRFVRVVHPIVLQSVHARRRTTLKALLWASLLATVAASALAQSFTPDFTLGFGSPITFATHTQLAGYGFQYGPSDGTFGGIPNGAGAYTFYGDAGSNSACVGTPSGLAGAFAFSGTLDQVTGGCRRVFGPGDAPAGWTFDKDYAGGGQVVRFSGG